MSCYAVLDTNVLVSAALPDIKDQPFYAVVMDKREEGAYLVTGNLRHFPREPFIVTPRELLELLESKA